MRAKVTYFTLAAVLVVYFVLVGSRGVLLIQQGTPVTVAFGCAVLVLPLIGVWFLWRTTRFARAADRLARELEAEGGLPVDELERTPSGRIDRDSADAVFAQRRAEAEAAPGDWRVWFRLAVAYHDARDTPRARTTMQHAIALHSGRGSDRSPSGEDGSHSPDEKPGAPTPTRRRASETSEPPETPGEAEEPVDPAAAAHGAAATADAERPRGTGAAGEADAARPRPVS